MSQLFRLSRVDQHTYYVNVGLELNLVYCQLSFGNSINTNFVKEIMKNIYFIGIFIILQFFFKILFLYLGILGYFPIIGTYIKNVLLNTNLNHLKTYVTICVYNS